MKTRPFICHTRHGAWTKGPGCEHVKPDPSRPPELHPTPHERLARLGVVGDGRGSGYFVLLRKNTLLSGVLARTVPHTTKVKDNFGVDLGLLNKNLIGTNILGKESAIPTPKIFYF